MKKLLFILSILYSLPSFSQEQKLDTLNTKKQESIAFSVIDEVPIHPNCENFITNQEKSRCFNKMIQKHVSKNFDLDVIDCGESNSTKKKKKKKKNCLGLNSGVKRIYLQFKIGVTGEIEDIQARAPHPKLQEEGIRIAKLLPVMIPGKQNGKAVRVGYKLPISFRVE